MLNPIGKRVVGICKCQYPLMAVEQSFPRSPITSGGYPVRRRQGDLDVELLQAGHKFLEGALI